MVTEAAENLFANGGAMGALLRSHDWSQTALGSEETWSSSLKTTLSIVLTSCCPMVLIWGHDRILFYNDAYAAVLKESNHAAFLGHSVNGGWATDHAALQADVEQVFSRRQPFRREQEPLADPDDTAVNRLYTWSYSPIRDDIDPVKGVLVTGRQIVLVDRQTAPSNQRLQHVEAALRQSEERYRSALQAAHMMTWTWDARTDTIVRSETACEILGLAPDALHWTGSKEWQPIHPHDLAQHRTTVQAAIDAGGSYVSEFRMTRPDNGALIWIEERGKVTVDATGQLLGIEGTLFDISDRKQAEAEREHLLKREQAAREVAEAANRIKDEFLAVLSHELRSPLNPILGWSKLLQTHTLNAQQTKQALEIIERNAKLQTQLIEDLLDVSRILRGKLVLHQATVNLVNTIAAALETVKLAADAKQIDLRFTIADTPPNDPKIGSDEIWVEPVADNAAAIAKQPFQVMGDSARLQQIVWNLLSNAVKFTPTGGTVDVYLERVNAHAQIRVRDTGKGINPEFLPYVFEYFRQEDGTTTRRFGGLGLGLAIVRHLTELHGGTIGVESPGEELGATFTVRLPLLRTQTDEKQVKRGKMATQAITSPLRSLTGVRVLVVDDQPDVREVVAFVLEQVGATVTTADSAVAALDCLKQSLPDVLVCDIGMPKTDGYMLIRQIRTLPPDRGGQLSAIALTAYAGETNRERALAAGFQQHLAKPVEPETLVQAIVNLVQQNEGREYSVKPL